MHTLNTHALFKKYKKVQMLCSPLKKLNITGFIYMRRYEDGRFIDLSNQIEWARFFLEKYLNEDYSVNAIQNHMLSENGLIYWSMDPDNLVWNEGSEIFGFGNGISIFNKKKLFCEIFCFYGSVENYHLNSVFIQSFPLLENFSNYFLANMQADIFTAYKNNDFLMTPKKYLNLKNKHLSEKQEKEFLGEIKKFDQRTYLSAREKDCVMLCASGKKAKETAGILSISPRTVEMHLANAKEKMTCKNIKELFYRVLTE